MTEPTEDEVLVKAKQLAHDDGRRWDSEDIDQEQDARDRLADAYRALSTTQPRCSRASIERWKNPAQVGVSYAGPIGALGGVGNKRA